MTEQEARAVYDRLFVAFPQVREWLTKVDDPKATYAVWCGVLAGVEAGDAMQVVDRMIVGDEPIPEAYERERMPQMIRRAASSLRSERLERRRMDKYHTTANEARTVDQKFIVAIRESRRLGELVRDGNLTRAENVAMVEELVEWSERNGPLPDWMNGDDQ